ncbi:MAG TPA: glycosyltransferase family 4 protein [Vicinamibacterales bacterium]|nr:glycosyltransferase family 4 protein [Vicinamibacterales bacterium]
MRILWVKAGKLLPVDSGGKIRSYNLLRQIHRRHDLTLLSYYGGKRDAVYDRDIGGRFPGARSICTGVPDESGLHYVQHVWSRVPYAVVKFSAPRVRHAVRESLASGRFDVCVCDFLSASLNFPRVLRTPTVLFQHNVESILWNRQARHEPNLLKRLAFALEAWKMRRYERHAVQRFDHVMAVSDADRDAFAQMTDRDRISVVPTGVDVAQYRPAASSPARGPLVMFLGSMDWEANVDAVEFFAREAWPAIKAAVPQARFRIVGRNPGARVRALASESIEVTGTVPSVVEHLQEAAAVVVPLRIGGGTRLKIFEAMAAGRAVVSTSVGAEGLDVVHDRDIVLADGAVPFARAVVDLLSDSAARERLGCAAAASAARYDWPEVAMRFEQILERVAAVSRLESAYVRPARVGA